MIKISRVVGTEFKSTSQNRQRVNPARIREILQVWVWVNKICFKIGKLEIITSVKSF